MWDAKKIELELTFRIYNSFITTAFGAGLEMINWQKSNAGKK
jgi:hypothetical protein